MDGLPLARRHLLSVCFKCGVKGHLARNCPNGAFKPKDNWCREVKPKVKKTIKKKEKSGNQGKKGRPKKKGKRGRPKKKKEKKKKEKKGKQPVPKDESCKDRGEVCGHRGWKTVDGKDYCRACHRTRKYGPTPGSTKTYERKLNDRCEGPCGPWVTVWRNGRERRVCERCWLCPSKRAGRSPEE